MHALLLTLALVTRALPGPAVHDRPAFQPFAIVLSAPAAMVSTQQQPPTQPQPPQINVEVNRGSRGWYLNPVWVAIGGLALVVVILLIVMAARGGGGSGGTTVVRG
jgi:hypothetical protein